MTILIFPILQSDPHLVKHELLHHQLHPFIQRPWQSALVSLVNDFHTLSPLTNIWNTHHTQWTTAKFHIKIKISLAKMRSHVLVVTCMHTIQIIPHYPGALNDCDKTECRRRNQISHWDWHGYTQQWKLSPNIDKSFQFLNSILPHCFQQHLTHHHTQSLPFDWSIETMILLFLYTRTQWRDIEMNTVVWIV